MTNLQQLTFDFDLKPQHRKRLHIPAPFPVRTLARRYRLPESMALAVCRANGIGGKGVL